METGVVKEISSRPLSTIAPRRINTGISIKPPAPSEDNQQDKQSLPQEELRMLQELKARDREVRAHEAAHIAAGRPYIQSGPNYTYQRGPDGRSYAIGGQVSLDTSEVSDDPQATLDKAEQVRRAALAPAQPSPQDLQVAANASDLAARARLELAMQRREDLESRIQDASEPSEQVRREPEQASPAMAEFASTTDETQTPVINQFV